MADPHWSDAYYGDLYFDSAADLLSRALSEAEAGVVWDLLRLRPGSRILDLACGHGRHAWPLAERGARVVGLDSSARYLRRAIEIPGGSPAGREPDPTRPPGASWGPSAGDGGARATAPCWIRGDVRALPLRDGAFDAAFSWYASLFMFDDARNLACLREVGRAVRPGGRLLVQHANPGRLELAPVDRSRRLLPDGAVVEEESRWDGTAGVDRCARRLIRPDGTVLAGTAELRYYAAHEWGPLATSAGLRLVEVTSTDQAVATAGFASGTPAPDLIAVLARPA